MIELEISYSVNEVYSASHHGTGADLESAVEMALEDAGEDLLDAYDPDPKIVAYKIDGVEQYKTVFSEHEAALQAVLTDDVGHSFDLREAVIRLRVANMEKQEFLALQTRIGVLVEKYVDSRKT